MNSDKTENGFYAQIRQLVRNYEMFPNGFNFLQKLKGSILGLYMGVWAEPYRLSPFMSSLFN